MIQKTIVKVAVFILLLIATNYTNAQTNFRAVLSKDGAVSFQLTESEFYIYVSSKGAITSFGALCNGSISYDFNGRVNKVGNVSVSYDYAGRIDKIGSTNISYNYSGQVNKIGATGIGYNFYGFTDKVGDRNIGYNYTGKADKIGKAVIGYNYNGNIDKITDDEGIIIFTN